MSSINKHQVNKQKQISKPYLTDFSELLSSQPEIANLDLLVPSRKDVVRESVCSFDYITIQGPRIVWKLGWGVENSALKCAVRVEN